VGGGRRHGRQCVCVGGGRSREESGVAVAVQSKGGIRDEREAHGEHTPKTREESTALHHTKRQYDRNGFASDAL
jgi:hypothetical protein